MCLNSQTITVVIKLLETIVTCNQCCAIIIDEFYVWNNEKRLFTFSDHQQKGHFQSL